MRRLPTPIEIAGYASLSIFGLFMLYEGTSDNGILFLVGGACGVVLGALATVFAIRNFLWHREMLRQSTLDQDTEQE